MDNNPLFAFAILLLVVGLLLGFAWAIGIKGQLQLIAGWTEENTRELADVRGFQRWVAASISALALALLMGAGLMAVHEARLFFWLITAGALQVPVMIFLGFRRYRKRG